MNWKLNVWSRYNEVNDIAKVAKWIKNWTSKMQVAKWIEICMCEVYSYNEVNDEISKWI